MTEESALDAWLDLWEDQRSGGQSVSLDEFVAQNCVAAPSALVEEFRAKALALRSMDAFLHSPARGSTGARAGDTKALGSGRSSFLVGYEPVPGYRLVERLGSGGFGEVWKADAPGGIPVALKFVRGERLAAKEAEALELFKRLRHPHLLAVSACWQTGDGLVVAYELAEGTLADGLRRHQEQGLPGVPAPELLRHMRDAAEALDYLNALNVQHRDVKPHNLLLVGGSVKVADYGLARLFEGTHATHSGMTEEYAPLEFFDGKTFRHSDQFSLAVSYCELRGGRRPFSGSSLLELIRRLAEPPDLTMLPDEERGVVARALSKLPEDRWPSCADFVGRLAATGSTHFGAPTATHAPCPALGKATKVVTNSIRMRLALIPAGRFLRGSPSIDRASSRDERPQREIEISRPFHLGVFPVTQGQYRRIMSSTVLLFEADDLPVVLVSHDDAITFCKALSGLPEERLAGRRYRLPTEAEWEYTCRAGAGTYQPFHFGISLSHDQANFDEEVRRTSPVGSYPANAWGLHDMHGNVWEWCSDWYDEGSYVGSPVRDPDGGRWGQSRVYRGGSWSQAMENCRSAHRGRNWPYTATRDLGFRVAMVESEPG